MTHSASHPVRVPIRRIRCVGKRRNQEYMSPIELTRRSHTPLLTMTHSASHPARGPDSIWSDHPTGQCCDEGDDEHDPGTCPDCVRKGRSKCANEVIQHIGCNRPGSHRSQASSELPPHRLRACAANWGLIARAQERNAPYMSYRGRCAATKQMRHE